jgi:hypothetical protein
MECSHFKNNIQINIHKKNSTHNNNPVQNKCDRMDDFVYTCYIIPLNSNDYLFTSI